MHKDLHKPSDEDAKEAVEVLIRWIGDSPGREGLSLTAGRVLNTYRESFRGYALESLHDFRNSVFVNEGYSDMILLRGVNFSSTCEHHMAPMTGVANISYIPKAAVLGVGAIIRVIDIFTKRLQLQERMTVQIAHFLSELLKPAGVAVLIEARHWCAKCSGGEAVDDLKLQTSCMLGAFQDDHNVRSEFFCRVGCKFS
ncbi:GTP cyclohydrolase I [Anaplasma centrale str. Israel]|uniref:GTP cyclohydrolase 1 n=1 Tax=Anaplasma centrale (strain Israel) TaxID=574556 RepID=D1AUN8_ANACI|nr:GTP cyclohydrolase I [Anaplasma centrale]ACZ49266.1 GTP cyclohydrolase I [Anaplasma centrale str. Israel]